jgi:hypothetical protein
MQARLEAMESRQLPANVLPVAPMAPAAHRRPFKMRNPAPFCGGADDLDRFLTHQQKNHMSSITSGSSSSNGSNGCFLNLRKQIVVDLVIPEANLF